MRPFFIRLVLLLSALAFASEGTAAAAMPAGMGADPCAHEHHHPADDHHGHKSGLGNCLACCAIGACVSGMGLPSSVSNERVTPAASRVLYWEAAGSIAGRLITPDTGPPKRSA